MKYSTAFISLAVLSLTATAQVPNRPNILFIAVDDLRPELGAYGVKAVKSPNIDNLAKVGVTFDHAYAQQALCSPSRSSVMTGARPDTTRVWNLATHFRTAMPNVVTLGEHFKQNGYYVQGMGKIFHGGYDDPQTWSTPWQTPSAPKYATVPDGAGIRNDSEEDPDGPSAGAGKPAKVSDRKSKSRGPVLEAANVPDSTFTDGKVADLAIATLGTLASKKEPFFLAVGLVRPHLPFVAPKKYWDLYDPAQIPMATNRYTPKDAPDYAIRNVSHGGEIRLYKDIPDGSFPDDLARQLKHGYYASVSYMDAQMGRVLAELDRLDLRKNTVIVVWGDHGWKLGEHDGWAKHGNTENDSNAPLIVSAPGMKSANTHSKALVEFVDIYPTLSELAGLPLPKHLEGISFKPLLDNPQLDWKSAAFSQYPRPKSGKGNSDLMGYTMRTDRYRFTQWVQDADSTQIDALELYDHQSDPQENQNIANRPEHASLVKSLRLQLNAGWQSAKPAPAKPGP